MNFIKRGVLVLKPKAPFLSWVKYSHDANIEITLEDISCDPTAYLTPELAGDEGLREFVEQNHSALFEHELVEWTHDEEEWPINRDLDTFNEWFEVEFHSMVLDLVDEAIEGEAKI
jgi:hypothetical protein